jgi:hypothetical protein
MLVHSTSERPTADRRTHPLADPPIPGRHAIRTGHPPQRTRRPQPPNMIAALRCLYRSAEEDGLTAPAAKPRQEGRQAAQTTLDPSAVADTPQVPVPVSFSRHSPNSREAAPALPRHRSCQPAEAETRRRALGTGPLHRVAALRATPEVVSPRAQGPHLLADLTRSAGSARARQALEARTWRHDTSAITRRRPTSSAGRLRR